VEFRCWRPGSSVRLPFTAERSLCPSDARRNSICGKWKSRRPCREV